MNERGHQPPAADTPADLLGPAWDLLDALPRATAPASMTATTVEMAAARPRPARAAWWQGWIAPVAVVAAAFVVGVAAGRGTGSDADQFVFDYLPVLEHYDVVREAGSVEFLTALARKNYPPPRRLFPRNGDLGPPASEALDAAVAAFATEPFGAGAGEAERRAAFSRRPSEERRRVADAAVDFQRLSSAGRRDLVQLARALGGRDGTGPDRDELLAAARLWHQWLATRDPADRKAVVELDTAERLEWLDYALARPGSGRGGAFRDGGGFRGFPPPGPPPEGAPPNGPPRFNGRPPFDPRREPPPPRETRAPPR